jgi:MerR family copper efflux transcriptional regulator
MKELTVGALAKGAGVKVETIRYYERRGLLRKPPKPKEGYRKYPIELIKQVRFIKTAQKLGFSLREIEEILNLGGKGELSCAEMFARANHKIGEIEGKIGALEAMRRVLLEATESCPKAGSLNLCPSGSDWKKCMKHGR